MTAGPSGSAIADIALLTRIAGRDAGALAELYDRHNRLLFSLILRVLRDRGESRTSSRNVRAGLGPRRQLQPDAGHAPGVAGADCQEPRDRPPAIATGTGQRRRVLRRSPAPPIRRRPATPNSWPAPPSIAAPSSPHWTSCQPSSGRSSTPPTSRASRSRSWPSASTCRLAP